MLQDELSRLTLTELDKREERQDVERVCRHDTSIAVLFSFVCNLNHSGRQQRFGFVPLKDTSLEYKPFKSDLSVCYTTPDRQEWNSGSIYTHLGPVVQKPIIANPRLKINKAFISLSPDVVQRWYSKQF